MSSASNIPSNSQTSAPVTIREMELEDLAGVYALGERLFTADRWPNLYRTWDEYELVGIFSSDGDTCLVAEREDKVVGFALGTMIDKRNSAWIYGYLLWLGVDPALKGRGIGKKLVEKLTNLFIGFGARMMLVDTDGDNKKAIRFFEHQGFGNPQHHVYMSRNLTSHPTYIEQRREAEQRRERPPHHAPRHNVPGSVPAMSLPEEALPEEDLPPEETPPKRSDRHDD
jgi:ribosomal protein S18 acetylase RimI-like enzyme